MIFKLIHDFKKTNSLYFCTKSISKTKLYSKTVLLPKTQFPLRLENKKLVERDEHIYNIAEFENLYSWQRSHLSEPEFVLHDGPPYANGEPHMGHAINKILKDVIIRYQILNGNKIHYVPGWDCHGLPIELKAISNSNKMDPIEIRSKARNFAKDTIQKQAKIFKSWGLIGDWKNTYTTYSTDYVKSQFRQFFKMYKKNLIYRDYKPIHWSPSTRTALAEAELEYNEKHKSPSAYIRFEVRNVPKIELLNGKRVYAIIWTTTPWTLPSNQAVCYNETLSYSLLKKSDPLDNDVYIMATELVEAVSSNLNCNFESLSVLSGEMLEGATYVHPVYKDQVYKFLNSPFATATKGTGLVHSAPAHGPEDFIVALHNNLPVVDMVNELGCYNSKVGLNLEGKFVLSEGNNAVLEIVKHDLMQLGEIVHSYPYDWRTKKPVIIKASQQWFIDTHAIKNRALELLENVNIIPKDKSEIYRKVLLNQIEKRPYWCISRQRKWGVPIPVCYDKNTSEVLINEKTINHHCNLLEQHGADFWWKLPMEELLPETLHSTSNLEVEKGQDIMDIWFDSGISWAKVLEGNKVADMYLEGVDQFNGWFQSSLLTSVAIRDKAPFKTIYVHGFAVDENGIKMSKSVGNVVDPVEVTCGKNGKKTYGVDSLRWWVACHANQTPQASVTSNVLQSSADEVQKIRSVLRFALGSLSDYEKSADDYNSLLLIDRYLLHLLYQYHQQVTGHIEEYNFHKVSLAIINFLTNPVSALYYTAVKDRLYCEQINSITRRAAQYTLLQIFNIVTQSIAPIVPHLAEEMFLYLPQKESKTYFTGCHLKPDAELENSKLAKNMEKILNIKKHINKELAGITLNTDVKLSISENLHNSFKQVIKTEDLEQQLIDILQVSNVTISVNINLIDDYVLDFVYSKRFSCPRCRRVQCNREGELCTRCYDIIQILKDNKTVVIN